MPFLSGVLSVYAQCKVDLQAVLVSYTASSHLPALFTGFGCITAGGEP